MKDYFEDINTKEIITTQNDLFAVNNKCEDKHQEIEPEFQPPKIYTSTESAIVGEISKIIQETIKCYTDYAKCREIEITERQRIKAQLKAYVSQIEARKSEVLNYIEAKNEHILSLIEMAKQVILQTKTPVSDDTEFLKLTYNLILNLSDGLDTTMQSVINDSRLISM